MKNRFLLLLLPLLQAGCATENAASRPVDFPVSPMMSTAYAGGVMTISWESEPGETYTVYYTDSPHGVRAHWKPLPKAKQLPGTGGRLTITDKPDTGGQRRYLLMSGDQTPY
jgi:hypothetical protein